MEWPAARQRVLAVSMGILSLLILSIAFKAYTTRDRVIDVVVAAACASIAIRAWRRRGPGDG
jgi:putative effector of murein hydrolase